MSEFVVNTTRSIVSRPGAASKLGEIVGPLLGERIVLVTDAVRRAGPRSRRR
ncbi:hypothetical protein WBO78_24680 [Bosea sp. CCNWLW174]|uniref:hypothetical protein n=1 Tax=unclassified Bosea (in: a-proteobacteria) TaxID=2653178 RepID=UPI0030153992